MDQDDPTQYIERTDYGYSVEITTTRGTDTRDQERITTKGKVRTFDEAVSAGDAMIDQIDQWAAEIREVQPDE